MVVSVAQLCFISVAYVLLFRGDDRHVLLDYLEFLASHRSEDVCSIVGLGACLF